MMMVDVNPAAAGAVVLRAQAGRARENSSAG